MMPQVIGTQETEAVERLEAAGISDFQVEELHSLETSGEVVDQHPSAGSRAIGTIVLTIAIPLPPMPDYAGQRVGDVRSELESWGVTVAEEPTLSSERPDDEVLETTPRAGDALGSEAILQVAVAPVIGAPGVDVSEAGVNSNGNLRSPTDGPIDVNGEQYETSLNVVSGFDAEQGNTAYWDYVVGRDWELFESTVGLLDHSDLEQRARFRILGDGSVIWEEDLAFGEEFHVEINISDYVRVKLEAVTLETGTIGMGWGSPRFLGVPGEAPTDG